MKDRIIEMLGRGERVELEFADKHGFLNQDQEYEHEREAIANSSLVVTKIVDDGMAICLEDTHYYIPEDDYKYFKIKEPKYTFNDLIDVVVQAYKDGVIPSLELGSEMGVRSVRCLASAILDEWDDYSNGVNNIKSLYTETFVIESEEDILNVKDEAEVLFLNGEVGIFADSTGDGYYGFVLISNVIHKLPLALLKGATVTQKRGNQCNK